MNYLKKFGSLIIAGLLALMVGFLFPISSNKVNSLASAYEVESSIVKQEVIGFYESPQEVTKLYQSGELIGIVTDYNKIEELINSVYQEKYAEDFPNSNIDLGVDIYRSEELAYYEVDDVDDQICAYLKDNDLFAIETNKIDFTDENGVYATIYVKSLDDFYEARNKFLLNFVSEDDLATFAANKETPELTTYGRRTTNVTIKEAMEKSVGLAQPGDILTSVDKILEYLCYGDNLDHEYYTVQKGDTEAGVGRLNNDLTPQQLMTINPGVIVSENQVLTEGMQINVSYFTSPITVEVTQELIQQEVIYPDETIYFEDSSLREGASYVSQEEEDGLKNVKYEEKWINGVLMEGTEVSSQVVKSPVTRIEYYGTKIIPGVGTGNLRYPVDNVSITCGWYCYAGHTAIDVKNVYNRYGNIYAADRGTVMAVGYTSRGGYYMRINHNNGMITYYGHMNKPAYFSAGVNVEKGEIIGQIGMTGRATGPHVHFMVEVNGVYVNPCNYLGC